MHLGLGLGMTSRRGAAIPPDASTTALVARMSSAPDGTRQGRINTLIVALKTAGVWTKIDCLYVLAAHDAQAGLLNWKGATFDLTAVSSPTFTVDRGYNGNGTTSYLESAFTPTTAGGGFVQNSAHLGVYSNVNTSAVIGNTSSVLFTATSPTVATVRLNGAAGATGTTVAGAGYLLGSREDGTTIKGYKNGVEIINSANASAAMSAETLRVSGRSPSSSASGRIAVAHWGSALTAVEAAAVNSALSDYLTPIGAA